MKEVLDEIKEKVEHYLNVLVTRNKFKDTLLIQIFRLFLFKIINKIHFIRTIFRMFVFI